MGLQLCEEPEKKELGGNTPNSQRPSGMIPAASWSQKSQYCVITFIGIRETATTAAGPRGAQHWADKERGGAEREEKARGVQEEPEEAKKMGAVFWRPNRGCCRGSVNGSV